MRSRSCCCSTRGVKSTRRAAALDTSRAFTNPRLAGRTDIAAIIAYYKSQTVRDGTPFTGDYTQRRLWQLKTILTFCRSARHMDDVPETFVLTASHLKNRLTRRRRDDDDPGKALPDEVVNILDRNLDRLRPPMTAQYRTRATTGVAEVILDREFVISRETVYQYLRIAQTKDQTA